jgi:hypothetical protein
MDEWHLLKTEATNLAASLGIRHSRAAGGNPVEFEPLFLLDPAVACPEPVAEQE